MRRQTGKVVGVDVVLAAKATADDAADVADLAHGQVKDGGQLPQLEVEALAVGVDRQPLGIVKVGHRDHRFHGGVILLAGLVATFDDIIRLGEALLHVADVHDARRHAGPIFPKVALQVGPDERGIGLHGLEHVKDWLLLLDVQLDLFQGFLQVSSSTATTSAMSSPL